MRWTWTQSRCQIVTDLESRHGFLVWIVVTHLKSRPGFPRVNSCRPQIKTWIIVQISRYWLLTSNQDLNSCADSYRPRINTWILVRIVSYGPRINTWILVAFRSWRGRGARREPRTYAHWVLGSRIFAHVGVCDELLLVKKREFLFQEQVRRERWRQPRDWRWGLGWFRCPLLGERQSASPWPLRRPQRTLEFPNHLLPLFLWTLLLHSRLFFLTTQLRLLVSLRFWLLYVFFLASQGFASSKSTCRWYSSFSQKLQNKIPRNNLPGF